MRQRRQIKGDVPALFVAPQHDLETLFSISFIPFRYLVTLLSPRGIGFLMQGLGTAVRMALMPSDRRIYLHECLYDQVTASLDTDLIPT
jgi:hypothetical protein